MTPRSALYREHAEELRIVSETMMTPAKQDIVQIAEKAPSATRVACQN